MALQLPGISYLRGYDPKNALEEFAKGFGFGEGIKNEREAKTALEKYVESLYGGAAPGGTVPDALTAAIDPRVRGAHDAAVEATDPMRDAYFRSTRRSESGGNDTAANPNSSALGRYQFLDSTWKGLMEAHPELGLTAEGRTDPAQQERAIRAFTMDNARSLRMANQPINPGTLYAAHFLGAEGASNVLGQADETPLMTLVGPEVIEANPFLRDMTVGQFREWAGRKGGNGSGGYAAPQMAQAGAPVSHEVLSALMANPLTREFGMELIKSGNEAGASTDDIKEYQFAVDQGYTGTFQDFLQTRKSGGEAPSKVREYQFYAEQEKAAGRPVLSFADWSAQNSGGFQVTTNPDGTVSVTQGMPKLTEGQSKDTVFVTRASGALPTLDALDTRLTSFGEDLAGNVPYGQFFQSDEYQQADQAGREFLAAVLRKDTGAAVTDQEMDNYGRTYLPRPGDKPGVLAQKKAARARAVKAMSLGLPPAVILELERQGVVIPDLPGTEPAGEPSLEDLLNQYGGE